MAGLVLDLHRQRDDAMVVGRLRIKTSKIAFALLLDSLQELGDDTMLRYDFLLDLKKANPN